MSDNDFFTSYMFLPRSQKYWSSQNPGLVGEIFARLKSLKLDSLGEDTPPSNTGVNLTTPLTAAKLDWFTISFDQEYFGIPNDKLKLSEEDVRTIEMIVRRRLCPLLEVDIGKVRGYGYNRYEDSIQLFSKGSGKAIGAVLFGGNRGTWTLDLQGSYCASARSGWEANLYSWIQKEMVLRGRRAKITRADCAHDDYKGENYSVDKAYQDYQSGLFKSLKGGRNPRPERVNWDNPHEGRTFYVAKPPAKKPKPGKMLRVYEKGKQLGDSNSPWVRIEVEFHSVGRIIPLEILLGCGDYLAGAYPALNWICEKQTTIKTFLKSAKTTVEQSLKTFVLQCGARLRMFRKIGIPLNLLEREASTPTGLPKNIQDLNIYAESPEKLKELLLGIFVTNKNVICNDEDNDEDFIFEF